MIQVQEKFSRFLHPFERQVKRMSPAGANPGDLDPGFALALALDSSVARDIEQIALANLICSHCWCPHDAGFRARTSGHFCVDKSNAKSTPGLRALRVPSLQSLTP
ncbi:hypothetical protein Dace_2467 [Desulfuromonas acetoxidans DSM 684]|uniref:Uncharacterized protein n=1 Tax=Desulfuromonas acetoxidans (strain DSM 684 / 11070) TaxID=281689 RepID=Q1JZX5_DESA6|nr:hypothetical protein Dace_2467 [Desulfuromonas acetoxidans DSM 684]